MDKTELAARVKEAAFLEVYNQFTDQSIAGLANNRQAVKMGQFQRSSTTQQP